MSAKKQTKKVAVKKVAKKATVKKAAKKATKQSVAKKTTREKAKKDVVKSKPMESNIIPLSSVPVSPGLGDKFTNLLSHLPSGTADKLLAILLKQGPIAARAAVDLAIARSKPGGLKVGLKLFRAMIN